MQGFFITGTDTGIGKTVAGAAVISVLRGRGADAVPMKPIQTGCYEQDGRLTSPDLQFYLDMTELEPTEDEQERMTVYNFRPACSPHLAARKQGVEVDIPSILYAAYELEKQHDMILVEGAGGVQVPITESLTMLHLMQALKLPVILVARSGLGTINHTLLSVQELKRAGVDIKGVIMCDTSVGEQGDIVEDNRNIIKNFGRIDILGHLPFIPSIANGTCSPYEFQQVAQDNLKL